MARIPDGELERLKREVSLARLIEGQGIALTAQGKDLACRCPWHEGDDTPSCIVSPKTNLWHCFGCDAGGSAIDWVMRTHKVSFRHACEFDLAPLSRTPYGLQNRSLLWPRSRSLRSDTRRSFVAR